jgi:hypothetical protein
LILDNHSAHISQETKAWSPEYKEMVADYDRAFPSVLRTRDVVTLVDERNV